MDTAQSSRAWYLVYTKPLQEKVARENLARQDYEAYLPLIRNRRRRAGRGVDVVEPMFPRYLFIHLNSTTDNWGPIRSTVGVANLVRFANRAARVPCDLIEALRVREDDAGLQAVERSRFERGARVRIEEGPFAGYEAIFHASSGQSRVLLLLEVAGKVARLQVDETAIGPL